MKRIALITAALAVLIFSGSAFAQDKQANNIDNSNTPFIYPSIFCTECVDGSNATSCNRRLRSET